MASICFSQNVMSWGDVSTGPAGRPPISCGPRILVPSILDRRTLTYPVGIGQWRLGPAGHRRAIGIQYIAAPREPDPVMSPNIIQRLGQMRCTVRSAGQERVQRDGQHARLILAFAIERVESIDDIGG